MRRERGPSEARPKRSTVSAGAVLSVLATTGALLIGLLTLGGTALAVPASETWAAELSVAGGDDANVTAGGAAVRLANTTPRATSAGPASAEGELLLAPRRVGAITDRLTADLTADEPAGSAVIVAVRGLRDDGSWSQWTAAASGVPAQLEVPTLQVQVRVTLVAGPDGTGPAVRRLWLTADRAADAAPRPAATSPFGARVYATRIGLVGNRTANGHRVLTADRFVALPSRRALASDGRGDYTVRVCAESGRCTWAPVWDLGPWNTKDDHWNPTGTRESFDDLPQGVPEAQAARLDGYRDGRDGSGRRVRNPAGIDLADGTFADLGMRDNGWVQATYLWTGTGRSGTAGGAAPVVVRAAASRAAASVGVVAPAARVPVDCSVTGVVPAGQATAPDRWLRLGPAQFVPLTALEVTDVPAC